MIKKPKYSRDFENPNLFLQKKAAQESRQSSFLCFFVNLGLDSLQKQQLCHKIKITMTTWRFLSSTN